MIFHLSKSLISVFSPPQCSKSCGAGHRRRALTCVDHNQQEVHEMYCVNQIRPPDIESCNTHACELIWITGEWTEVRAKGAVCHLNDVVPLKLIDVNRKKPVCTERIVLHPSKRPFIWITISFKPRSAEMTEITHVSCVEYCCCLMPLIYSLLQCSASCGQGYRQRLISCSEVHVENDNYEYGHQSLSNCPGTPPESYMPCNLDPCPPPQEWRVGIWGLVSVFVSLNVVQSFIRIVDAWV